MSRDEAVVLHVEIPNDAAAALVGRAAAKMNHNSASRPSPTLLIVVRRRRHALLLEHRHTHARGGKRQRRQTDTRSPSPLRPLVRFGLPASFNGQRLSHLLPTSTHA